MWRSNKTDLIVCACIPIEEQTINFYVDCVIGKVIHPKYYKHWCVFHAESKYRKVASSNTTCLGAHAGFFKLLIKGIFDHYVLWPFDKKLIS